MRTVAGIRFVVEEEVELVVGRISELCFEQVVRTEADIHFVVLVEVLAVVAEG